MTRSRWIGMGVVASASVAFAQPPDPEPHWAPPLLDDSPPAPWPAEREGTAPPPPASTPATYPTPTPEAESGSTMEIYGFAMLDSGYDVGKIGDPKWQDTLRP